MRDRNLEQRRGCNDVGRNDVGCNDDGTTGLQPDYSLGRALAGALTSDTVASDTADAATAEAEDVRARVS